MCFSFVKLRLLQQKIFPKLIGMRPLVSGVNGGLFLELDTEQYDYLFLSRFVSSSAGFKVIIHDPNLPMMATMDRGALVSAGAQTRISLQREVVGEWNTSNTAQWLALHIDGLVQDCSNSSAVAMELLQPYTKPQM